MLAFFSGAVRQSKSYILGFCPTSAVPFLLHVKKMKDFLFSLIPCDGIMAQRMHSGVNVCAQPWTGVKNSISVSGWVLFLRNVFVSIQAISDGESSFREKGGCQWLKQSHLKKSICTARNAKYAWGRKLEGQLSWGREHFSDLELFLIFCECLWETVKPVSSSSIENWLPLSDCF